MKLFFVQASGHYALQVLVVSAPTKDRAFEIAQRALISPFTIDDVVECCELSSDAEGVVAEAHYIE